MSRIPSGPQNLGMDLTSTPATLSRQSISQQSDTLILERFTKEAEKLASQAPATGDLARSLQQATEHARNLTRQLSESADAARTLGTNLKEAFTGLINAVKGATGQGGQRTPTGISGAVVGGAITGVAIASITRNVATRIATSSETRRAVERVGRAQLTRSQIESRTQAQQGGGLLSKLNDPNTTRADIAGMGLPGIGSDENSPTVRRLIEERDKRAFANEEEVSGRLKIGGEGTEKGKKLAAALRGEDDLGKRKPLTPHEQLTGDAEDALKSLKRQVELEKEREKFNKSKLGIANAKEQASEQKKLNALIKAADWKKQVEEMGPLRANLSFIADKANEYGINLTRIGQLGQAAFAGGAGLIASTSAIANPVEWQTFKRSIEGVAASVGTIFSPVLNEMSGYLQRAADWFDSLSESTKSWLGRTVVAVTVGGGLVLMLSRIGPMAVTAGLGLLKLAGGIERFVSITLGLGSTVGVIATIAVGVATLAAAWWGANAAVDAFGRRVGQANQQVEDRTRADRLNRVIQEIPAADRARIQAGGTPEETERRLNAYRTQLDERISAADRQRITAVGRSEAEQERMQGEHERALPGSRRRFLEEEQRRATRNVTLGLTEPETITNTLAQINARRRAEEALPYPLGAPGTARPQAQIDAERTAVDAQRQRLIQTLMGRDPGAPMSPAVRAAQTELDKLNEQRTRINTELGTSPLRQSLQGLLPAAQAFTDPAQIGEAIALKSMEARGEQDIILALKNLVSIANAMGTKVENIQANTDWGNMIRLMGGFTHGR